MFKFIFFALISLSAVADEWTTADTNREIAYMVLHVADWAQTRNMALNPDKYAEGGFVASRIIGEHPSVAQVNQYMIGTAILQYAIAKSLPSEYRNVFQYITIVDSASSVIGNFRLGINISF